MKPDKERGVECNDESSPEIVNVGESFFYQFHRHGSVGEDAEFQISDQSIIHHERTDSEYLYPERMKPGWTGGDAERCKWFFTALKPGRAVLTVRTLFRFDVEEECQVHIEVKG